jgi:hypothetical protein
VRATANIVTQGKTKTLKTVIRVFITPKAGEAAATYIAFIIYLHHFISPKQIPVTSSQLNPITLTQIKHEWFNHCYWNQFIKHKPNTIKALEYLLRIFITNHNQLSFTTYNQNKQYTSAASF